MSFWFLGATRANLPNWQHIVAARQFLYAIFQSCILVSTFFRRCSFIAVKGITGYAVRRHLRLNWSMFFSCSVVFSFRMPFLDFCYLSGRCSRTKTMIAVPGSALYFCIACRHRSQCWLSPLPCIRGRPVALRLF